MAFLVEWDNMIFTKGGSCYKIDFDFEWEPVPSGMSSLEPRPTHLLRFDCNHVHIGNHDNTLRRKVSLGFH